MKQKNNHAGMWDLLIPLLCVISILPFVIKLVIYDCGYSGYPWYAGDGILSDFFCCYKSYFLNVIGFFAGVILLFFMTLFKERSKPMLCFIPLGIYSVFVVLSTVFSKNPAASVRGNFESFESCFVLLSYIVLSVYAYQLMEYEKDYRLIFCAVFFTSVLFLILGASQILGHDFFDSPVIQKLIINQEQAEMFGNSVETVFSGNNVYLTLYNPNYAGIVLGMLFAVLFVFFLTETENKKRVVYAIVSMLLFIVTWFTYSRAALVSLCMTVILALTYNRKKALGGLWKTGCLLCITIVFLVLADLIGGSRFLSRFIDKNEREPLTELTTDEEGIFLTYDKREYRIFLSKDRKQIIFEDMKNKTDFRAAEGEELCLPMDGAKLFFVNQDVPRIYLYLAQNTLFFTIKDGVFLYELPNGKTFSLKKIPAVDFGGYEYLGSARVYIWSRVLPLLRKYILIGSGPDTFAEVFPQEDVAGKVVYADNAFRIIEKAHNDFLTKWIQTGFFSVIALIVFYIILIVKGNRFFINCALSSAKERLGLGCYLACISYLIAGLFNDSTVQTAPLFWVFAGVALSSIHVPDFVDGRNCLVKK